MRTNHRRLAAAAAVLFGSALVTAFVAGCGGPTPSSEPFAAGSATPQPNGAASSAAAPTGAAPVLSASGTDTASSRPDHVVVLVFENKAYTHVKGNPRAPYLNALRDRSANFVNARAETHPSQPNYFALFSGSTQGVTDDSCQSPFHDRPNLASQLIKAGLTFTAYSEDLPHAGYRGCT